MQAEGRAPLSDGAHGDAAAGDPGDVHGDVHGEAHGEAQGDAVEDPTTAGPPRQTRLLLTVALVVILLDQLSKAIVVATMSDRAPIELLGAVLTITSTRNPGAAFSIGTSYTWIFTLVAIGVSIVILRSSRRLASRAWAVALGGLLGGAVGNLLDRLFREPAFGRGYVVDWIELPRWPVFNLADSAIVCAGALMVVLAFRGIAPDGSRG